MGVELITTDVENCNKDDLFKDSLTSIDNELEEEECININQSEMEEKCEGRQSCKDRNKQKEFNFSDVKKSVILRSSKRNIRRSQFLQVAKIGRKGFARNKDESYDRSAHDQGYLRSGKTKFGQSSRSFKHSLGKQTKVTKPKSVSRSLAQKASKGKMKSSKKYGRSGKSLKSNSNKKYLHEKNQKLKGSLSDSEDETSSDNEDGFVEEVEWTTKVEENKFPEKEKQVGIKKNSPKGEKSHKQRETNTVEVLLMDVDDVKLLDDVTSVIENEHGESSRNERNTNMDENYDSDVIVID